MEAMEKGFSNYSRPKRSWTTSIAILTLVGFFGIAAIVTKLYTSVPFTSLGHLVHNSDAISSTKDTGLVTDCGETREEAIAKGCVFDIMYNGWLQPLCHDADLHNEAMQNTTLLAQLTAAGPFPWYRDDNHTIPIHQDDLWTIEEGYAFSWETYHVAHCLYDWRFLVKSINRHLNGEEVWIPERIMDAEHIHHCNVVVASQTRRIGAKVQVIFGQGKCVRLQDSYLVQKS